MGRRDDRLDVEPPLHEEILVRLERRLIAHASRASAQRLVYPARLLPPRLLHEKLAFRVLQTNRRVACTGDDGRARDELRDGPSRAVPIDPSLRGRARYRTRDLRVPVGASQLGGCEPVLRRQTQRRDAPPGDGGRLVRRTKRLIRRTKRLIRRFRRFRSAGALGSVRLNRGGGARGEVVDAAQNLAPAEQRGERPVVGKLERIVVRRSGVRYRAGVVFAAAKSSHAKPGVRLANASLAAGHRRFKRYPGVVVFSASVVVVVVVVPWVRARSIGERGWDQVQVRPSRFLFRRRVRRFRRGSIRGPSNVVPQPRRVDPLGDRSSPSASRPRRVERGWFDGVRPPADSFAAAATRRCVRRIDPRRVPAPLGPGRRAIFFRGFRRHLAQRFPERNGDSVHSRVVVDDAAAVAASGLGVRRDVHRVHLHRAGAAVRFFFVVVAINLAASDCAREHVRQRRLRRLTRRSSPSSPPLLFRWLVPFDDRRERHLPLIHRLWSLDVRRRRLVLARPFRDDIER